MKWLTYVLLRKLMTICWYLLKWCIVCSTQKTSLLELGVLRKKKEKEDVLFLFKKLSHEFVELFRPC
jgi:hypothetical protein